MTRVALIGAGYISRVHAEAIRLLPGIQLAATIDPILDSARALAANFNIPQVFASLQEALAADAFDRAHVVVPPDRHADVAMALIAAGKAALIEKPFADSATACGTLVRLAEDAGVPLGVNQNFVHHPAFARLLQAARGRVLGRPIHLSCIYNMPLRQIAARQFGHWMFAAPGNLLLEQAVHPLSQIVALAGDVGALRVLAGSALPVAPGQTIYPSLDAILSCKEIPVSLRFAVGQSYPCWQASMTCDDGVAVADMVANRFYMLRRTRWLEAVDGVASAGLTALAMAGASVRNARDYGLSQLRLKPRNDPFFQSMLASIRAFHEAVDARQAPDLDAAFGAKLVKACERMRDQAFAAPPLPAAPAPAVGAIPPQTGRQPALAILGGTGFIGVHLVRRCIAEGLAVSVMARSTRGLPEIFQHPLVHLHRGDVRDYSAVAAAIAGTPAVANLAHGGGGASRDEICAAMVGGAETVARACLASNVRRLVHVGSIAGLYLGAQKRPITGATPPDEKSESRADYAHAKAVCDRMLLEMHQRAGLPVVILRPGVVVGEGGPAFHGGLGFFNNEQHCIGWNSGLNPLPFVLVEDVADAILRACRADGVDGRCYNIVGDVRPSARKYIADLGAVLQRPLKFHPQSPPKLFAAELAKWAVKRAGGKRSPVPSLRDLVSRGMEAVFDCTDAKHDLGWTPVSEVAAFHDGAIAVHGR